MGGQSEHVVVGLGTNMGDRLWQLRRALCLLASHRQIRILAVSRIYETEYVGTGVQDPYYNACVELETELAPDDLLAFLKGLERAEGRQRAGHMLPRPIDLDILLFGDRILASDHLVVPHKEMRERAFVMEPLAEIRPAGKFPDSGETMAAVCAKIRQKEGPWVRPLADQGLVPETMASGPVRELNQEDWRAALAIYRS